MRNKPPFRLIMSIFALVFLSSCSNQSDCGDFETYPEATFKDSTSVVVPLMSTSLRYVELTGESFGIQRTSSDKDTIAPTYIYNEALGDTTRFVISVYANVKPDSRLPFGSRITSDSLRM